MDVTHLVIIFGSQDAQQDLRLFLEGNQDDGVQQQMRELQDHHVATAGQWLQGEHEKLYMVMTSLLPQKKLMSKSIEISGSVSEINRLHVAAQTNQRCFRIEEFFNAVEPGRWLHTFQEHVQATLASADTWELCVHDEATASDIVRLRLRSSATAAELIQWRCKSYPCQLFKVLEDAEAAEKAIQVYRDTPCLLDEFSLQHISAFPSASALRSQDSVQILSALAVHFLGSIYSTESLHSRNSKRAKHRLTHNLSVRNLAMWHQVRAQPPWLLQEPPCQ